MNLAEILPLHRIVKRKNSSSLKAFVVALDDNIIKQILVTYLRFFFIESNRVKYLQNHESSTIHSSLINNIKNTFVSIKNAKRPSLRLKKLDAFPQLLLSHIISFLDYDTRIISSHVNHSFFTASKNLIAQSHIYIHHELFDTKLFPSKNKFKCNYNLSLNKYSSIHFSKMYKKSNKQEKQITQYFVKQAKQVTKLKHVTLDRLSYPNTVSEFLNHLNPNQLSSFEIARRYKYTAFNDNIYKNIINSVQSLKVHRLKDIKHLLINDNAKDDIHGINISNDDVDIKKYVIHKSVLQHLDLSSIHYYQYAMQRDNNDSKMPLHPIYWLWNIPTLKSCNMCVGLNDIDAKTFKNQCKQLLLSSIVRNKANIQNFNELNIQLRFLFKYSKGLAVFFYYIKRIYPNLNTMRIKMDGQMRYKDKKLNLNTEYQLQWSKYFDNFIHLEIEQLDCNSVTMLLAECESFHKLQVLHLKRIDDVHENTINNLCDAISDFLLKRPKNLHSFVICANKHGMNCTDLVISYFLPYLKLFKCLLQMISKNDADSINIEQITQINTCNNKRIVRKYENDNNKYKSLMMGFKTNNENHSYNRDTYDGYLKLYLPVCGTIYKQKHGSDHWWTKQNINISLNIAQIICKMQIALHKYNMQCIDSENKVILDLNYLQLYKEHDNFLKFWFGHNDEIYKNSKRDSVSKIVFL